jgi:hypothetical protein
MKIYLPARLGKCTMEENQPICSGKSLLSAFEGAAQEMSKNKDQNKFHSYMLSVKIAILYVYTIS